MSSLYHHDPVVVSFQVSQIPMKTIHSWFISHSLMSHHHHTTSTYNDTIYSKQIKPQWAYSTPHSTLRPSLYHLSLSLSLSLSLYLFCVKAYHLYILHNLLCTAWKPRTDWHHGPLTDWHHWPLLWPLSHYHLQSGKTHATTIALQHHLTLHI